MAVAAGPKSELKYLKKSLLELEERYLSPHLTPATLGKSRREEELDVAAFSVLTHGALENYVEGLAVWALARLEKNWIFRKRASRGTAALLLQTEHSSDNETDTRSVFDALREALDKAKNDHSRVIQKNNGIAVKHLRSLLSPLGVDVPTDPLLIGSLDVLVKMRHSWAHQSRFGAKTVRSAADAKKTVGDCVALAEKLYNNIVALRL